MNGADELRLRELLKDAGISAGEPQLEQDLWPRMFDRLRQPPPARVTPLDWVLIAVAILVCSVFPEVIPALVCHL